MRTHKITFTIAICLLIVRGFSQSTVNTIGTIVNDVRATDEYILFTPHQSQKTYLVDNCGLLLHAWTSNTGPGNSVYLLENGNLLRTGRSSNPEFSAPRGQGGLIELLDWDSNVLWEYRIDTGNLLAHHDIAPMANGNVLVLIWEKYDSLQSIAAGRNPDYLPDAQVWSEAIFEIDPSLPSDQAIVWEWHLWDHLVQEFDGTKDNFSVVNEHPELVDLNYTASTTADDWIHANSIDYNEDLDQIVLSARNFNEFWIIDHSTTTAESSSHSGGASDKGGDIIYRWGNPITYQAGTENDKQSFGQHDVQWIKSGNPDSGKILIFNNGRDRAFTTVDVIETPKDSSGNYFIDVSLGNVYGPDSVINLFTNDPPEDFFAPGLSGAQQMANGNILICNGPQGTFFEVDRFGREVWKYINPDSERGILSQGDSHIDSTRVDNKVFRVTKLPKDYAGFQGRDLTPTIPIEQNPNPCEVTDKFEDIITTINLPELVDLNIFPNPVKDIINVNSDKLLASIHVYSLSGQLMKFKQMLSIQRNNFIDVSDLPPGLYIIAVQTLDGKIFKQTKIILQ